MNSDLVFTQKPIYYQIYANLLGFGLLIMGFVIALLGYTESIRLIGIIGCFIGLFILFRE